MICTRRVCPGTKTAVSAFRLLPLEIDSLYLDGVDESLDSDAGDPADDAADGEFPVVVVVAAGGVLPGGGLAAAVISSRVAGAWDEVQSHRFILVILIQIRHVCRRPEGDQLS